jgi:succinyl-CoA synthetase beta subunit
MKLYEFEGKTLFQRVGIPVPEGDLADSVEKARAIADRIGFPVAVKSQILGGGRGKAGGILFARTQEDLEEAFGRLLGMSISGEPVRRVLIEKRVPAEIEFYAGITLDLQASIPVLMVSAGGGVDVEALSSESSSLFHRLPLHPDREIRIHHLIDLVLNTGITGGRLRRIPEILLKLIRCYFRYEAVTAEINPLIVGPDDRIFAADARMEIDDSALFRLPEIKAFARGKTFSDSLEEEAAAAGVSYVRLDGGDIGLISGGAGLGMASMDMISNHGGSPANFLDLGGDATSEKTAAALKVVLKTPGVKGVLLNVFGGINNCEQMAGGITRTVDEMRPEQSIVVKMRGHSQDEGWTILEERNIPVVKYGTTEEAVIMLLKEMKTKGAS